MKLTKEELEQRREWLKQNIEPLQSKLNEVEAELKKLEESDFDFQKLMPVGSVWLGNLVVNSWQGRTITFLRQFDEDMAPTIYHAHRIVKAAQRYIESQGTGWHNLNDVVEAAEEAGVLQNLQ